MVGATRTRIQTSSPLDRDPSLVDSMKNLDLSFAIVSETWLIDGPVTDGVKEELNQGYGLDLLTQNRRTTQGRNTGGGVAIVFRKKDIMLRTYRFKKNSCELVAATGKLKGSSRPLFIIGAYIPPA